MTQSDDAKPNTDGAAVLRSWQDNAVPWIDAIRHGQILSRTISSWPNMFSESGFHLTDLIEPPHPETGLPASVIIVLEL